MKAEYQKELCAAAIYLTVITKRQWLVFVTHRQSAGSCAGTKPKVITSRTLARRKTRIWQWTNLENLENLEVYELRGVMTKSVQVGNWKPGVKTE